MNPLNTALQAAFHGAPILWAGTEESFDVVVRAQQQVEVALANGTLQARVAATDENGLPMIWEKRGAVAVINVSGSLVDGSAGWMRYFGVVGYDDLAMAAIEAYTDPDVKSVMWKIESPGGQVSGLIDLAAMATTMSGIKKSGVYSSNQVCSGGYWLATAIKGQLSVGPTCEAGSIGVMCVHTDYTKMLEIAGIKKTVIRSGENKARVNPFEPLTADVKAKVERDMGDVHSIFRAQVAKGRPALSADDLATVSDGSTFLGKRAKSAGLVDTVSSFEQALKLLDSEKPAGNTPSNSKGATMKTQLTTEQIALMASGVPLEGLGLSAEQLTEVKEHQAEVDAQVTAAAAKKVTDDAAEAAAAAAAKASAANPPTAGPDVATQLVTANAQVDLLKSQLVTAQAEVTAKTAAFQTLEASTTSMKASHEGLIAVARKAIGRMHIGLGMSAAASETLDAAACVAEFARVEETFNTKFKVGGVTKPVTETKVENADTPELREFKRRATLANQNRNK